MYRMLITFILVLTSFFVLSSIAFAKAGIFEPIEKSFQLCPESSDSKGLGWPSGETILQKAVPKDKIPSSDFEYLDGWLHTVIKKEWIPGNLKDYFILLENLYVKSDYFIGRYKKNNNIIQIKIGDDSLWLTIKPSKGPSAYKNNEEFALSVMKTFLNYDKKQLTMLKVSTNKLQDCGEFKIERPKTQESPLVAQYRYWYEDIEWQLADHRILFHISPPKEVKLNGKAGWVKTGWKAGMLISK